ncbi:MAG: glutamyl-tRNA reductase [Chryseobacterium sp.]|nr:MAG: glutamyl-tRNA reductase [Chryseobacterium sp.]
MEKYNMSRSTTFYAVGLSYKKADAELRGKFSLGTNAESKLLHQAKAEGIESLIVISTCNRTEIYGFAHHPYELIRLLCDNSSGTLEEFRAVAYIYKNHQAVDHMFRVATGLDSQILGDFEIISQIKMAFNHSNELSLVNTFLDRLVSSVIQASKKVKTDTEISSGATSVSFAAVQYIIRNFEDPKNKHILLFGTGKIGRNTCENLVKHTKNANISLINRTRQNAETVAGKLNVMVREYDNLKQEIQQADVLIVATGAPHPTIERRLLQAGKPLLILDLSIPRNVNPDVAQLPGVTLIHMDYLSRLTDQTLERRRQHIPAAEAIIEDQKAEFNSWINGRKYVPTIHALKSKLHDIVAAEVAFQKKKTINGNEPQVDIISSRIIQKITDHFAFHLKNENVSLDESIQLIEKVFQIGPYGIKSNASDAGEKYKINLS